MQCHQLAGTKQNTCVCVCVCVARVFHHFYQVSRLSVYGHTGVLGSGRSHYSRPTVQARGVCGEGVAETKVKETKAIHSIDLH